MNERLYNWTCPNCDYSDYDNPAIGPECPNCDWSFPAHLDRVRIKNDDWQDTYECAHCGASLGTDGWCDDCIITEGLPN